MEKVSKPLIRQIPDNLKELDKLYKDIQDSDREKDKAILMDYPTVYIHNWKNTDKYEVYIGESNDFFQRTKQHYEKIDSAGAWQKNLKDKSKSPLVYLIGHEHFNKSLTLDVENRLMQYMMSCDSVAQVHNKRDNPQNEYYLSEELDEIFRKIWSQLRKQDDKLFLPESEIRDSAIFKASPLHKLTSEQRAAKLRIVDTVEHALRNGEKGQLVFVEGEAGTGKTVLNSATFYDFFTNHQEDENFSACLLVNHNQQLIVYQQIAEKLGIVKSKKDKVVDKPTSFINRVKPEKPVTVTFVDEGHLLLTRGKMSYTGNNQLEDILERSQVTVVMFDRNQVLNSEQYWEEGILQKYKNKALDRNNFISLTKQMRMQASMEMLKWIDSFTKEGKVLEIPKPTDKYEIKVFETVEELEEAINEKAKEKESNLSRLVATYDWPYSSSNRPTGKKYWDVRIGKWNKPWNYELSNGKKGTNECWAEQKQTIKEVGSTFSIQGFDLNYVGVILGPSVKFRNGKIIFDPNACCDKKATENRTMLDGSKQKFSEEFIKHAVRVLMTRGVNGLYIYAVDEELRKELLNKIKQ